MSLDIRLDAAPDGLSIPRPTGISPHVARRAVEWLVELQSDDAGPQTYQALQIWLSEHSDHARAWEHIGAVNGRLRGAASPVGTRLASAALAPRRSVQRRDAMKGLAVLLFAGGTAWVAEEQTPWRAWTADARTGTGERRTLTLSCGTQVTLNTRSAIDIRFSAAERRVRLVEGEVLVNTAKDTLQRPFVVETAQGELQPLGTRFNVRQGADASHVDVFEGAVAVRPRDGEGAERTVRAGEKARFTRLGVDEPAAVREADAAWKDGMLVASGMRLDDFLAEVSRHRPGRLGCDPAVAHLRVSGSYPLAETDRILESLQVTLPVRVHTFSRYWVSVRPKAA